MPPSTLDALFLARARAQPDAEVLRLVPPPDAKGPKGARPDKPVAVTYAELERRAKALAVGLLTLQRARSDHAEAGLPPAARIAILCGTRLEWVLADLACVMAGLVSVPLFPNVEPETLKRVLIASDSQVVIAENPWQAKKLLDIEHALPAAPHLVLIDEVMTLASGASATLDELGPRGTTPVMLAEIERRGERRELAPAEAHPDECWTICYTPGTEGQPKGVMWTHDNLRALAAQLGPILPPPDKPGREPEVQLLTTPLAQALPRAMLWVGLVGTELAQGQSSAAPLVTALARSEATTFDDAKLLRPTIMIGVPSTYERARSEVLRGLQEGGAIPAMVARWALEPSAGEPTLGERLRLGIAERVVKPALVKRFGGRCRLFIAGGAPLGEGVQGFYHRFGIPLRECYGLVETAALTHLDADATATIGTVGKPLPGVELRLADDGELLVRGPQVSPGYWRDPGETSKVFDAQGWFSTGDLARIDEQGRLHITGRKREIIVLSNGRTLAPRPIEAALREEALVSQALVHGERRDFATALIALDRVELERLAETEGLGHLDFEGLSRHPAVHARISALVQRVNQQLPPHAAIKKHAVLAAELSTEAGTLTPTQVPRRAMIAEHYKSLLDSFYKESF